MLKSLFSSSYIYLLLSAQYTRMNYYLFCPDRTSAQNVRRRTGRGVSVVELISGCAGVCVRVGGRLRDMDRS